MKALRLIGGPFLYKKESIRKKKQIIRTEKD